MAGLYKRGGQTGGRVHIQATGSGIGLSVCHDFDALEQVGYADYSAKKNPGIARFDENIARRNRSNQEDKQTLNQLASKLVQVFSNDVIVTIRISA